MGVKDLDVKQLVKAYKNGISAYRLAKNNKCSIWSVITRLREAGVIIRPDGTPRLLTLSPKARKIFDSLNTGLLLGDASINGNRTTRHTRCFLRIEQSNKRLGWLKQITNIYSELGVHVNIIPVKPRLRPAVIEGRKISAGPSSLLYTGVSNEFRELRRFWYPNDGVKCVPHGIKLDALSIAMWFCGDGAGDKSSTTFYTNGFNQKDVEFLSMQLNKLDIESTVKLNSRGEHVIKVTMAGSSKLKFLILPHMPKCCLYKLRHVK